MAASKQASKHTHAHAQCSHTSVGLARLTPNIASDLCKWSSKQESRQTYTHAQSHCLLRLTASFPGHPLPHSQAI